MSQNKALKVLIREVEAQGYVVTKHHRHYHVKTHAGGFLATLPASPGRGRWEQNIRALLRRIGVLQASRGR